MKPRRGDVVVILTNGNIRLFQSTKTKTAHLLMPGSLGIICYASDLDAHGFKRWAVIGLDLYGNQLSQTIRESDFEVIDHMEE